MTRLKQQLQNFMYLNGVTQKEIANMAGLHPQTVSRFLAGFRLSASAAEKVARAIGVSCYTPEDAALPETDLQRPLLVERLDAKRKLRGLSVRDLAAKATMDPWRLAEVLSGRGRMGPRLRKRLERALR